MGTYRGVTWLRVVRCRVAVLTPSAVSEELCSLDAVGL